MGKITHGEGFSPATSTLKNFLPRRSWERNLGNLARWLELPWLPQVLEKVSAESTGVNEFTFSWPEPWEMIEMVPLYSIFWYFTECKIWIDVTSQSQLITCWRDSLGWFPFATTVNCRICLASGQNRRTGSPVCLCEFSESWRCQGMCKNETWPKSSALLFKVQKAFQDISSAPFSFRILIIE